MRAAESADVFGGSGEKLASSNCLNTPSSMSTAVVGIARTDVAFADGTTDARRSFGCRSVCQVIARGCVMR